MLHHPGLSSALPIGREIPQSLRSLGMTLYPFRGRTGIPEFQIQFV